ncbi:Isoquinoline 1-oxidoreductase subunit [Rhizobium lentis]|uniref:Isoquinoline 1-oxidoreductase subunit n=1 Tax=Rhizobium lentis TaxID=1138194 RepID=A0ABS7IA46_9HYPH|nr:Isoquinoline 1-oxidoreductase subunit [Rhizobium lentis]MBX5088331.1 Isoquinoline 1-oxidoreductase subunit [Rhizobium lentis]
MTIKRFLIATVVVLSVPSAFAQTNDLRSPGYFNSISDSKKKSVALFEEMTKVITSPRCMNCHPVDDNPRQGNDMHLHVPPMVRWNESDFGPPGLHCSSCHSIKDIKFSGTPGTIPGHDPWRLAPKTMGWIGLSHGEICAQLKDPKRNGGRTLEDIIVHHATDKLVGTAWHSTDKSRPNAPGNQEIFAALTKAWVETGAVCPD